MRERKSRSRSATTTSLTCNMVPQQQTSNGSRAESPTNSNGQPVFGSLMVDRKSSTPYSDATQVGIFCWCVLLMKFLSFSVCVCVRFSQCLVCDFTVLRALRVWQSWEGERSRYSFFPQTLFQIQCAELAYTFPPLFVCCAFASVKFSGVLKLCLIPLRKWCFLLSYYRRPLPRVSFWVAKSPEIEAKTKVQEKIFGSWLT